MTFEPLNFDGLNETDIREEVLAPLIRFLGYRSGTDNDVIRELSLHYPHIFLGRKDGKKDPQIRGRADYILVAKSKIRWVIEAKPPGLPISQDDIEQAYTYANHPEIRAVYFVLSNGRITHVYQTNRGPGHPAIFSFEYEELPAKQQQILNLLSPRAILRDHPGVVPDIGIPLGYGLRSYARIANGHIKYYRCTVNIPALSELQINIVSGTVSRDDSGKIIAYLRTVGPSHSMQEVVERLGIDEIEMICEDEVISDNVAKPSIFKSKKTMVIPKGETITDVGTWTKITLPFDFVVEMNAQAAGILEENVFTGRFVNHATYVANGFEAMFEGEFKITLA